MINPLLHSDISGLPSYGVPSGNWYRLSQDFLFIGFYSKLWFAELVEGIVFSIHSYEKIAGGDSLLLRNVLPNRDLKKVVFVNNKNQILFSYPKDGEHHVVMISFSSRIKS